MGILSKSEQKKWIHQRWDMLIKQGMLTKALKRYWDLESAEEKQLKLERKAEEIFK